MTANELKNSENMLKSAVFELGNDSVYDTWRAGKLSYDFVRWDESIVTVCNMAAPKRDEILSIVNLCQKFNIAIYDSRTPILTNTLLEFCGKLGLHNIEGHRSAADNGVVSIEQTSNEKTSKDGRGGYIPYTNKPLSWHTDGYYNAPADRINAMVLHCVRDASQGGVNELLDPEIAYIRLRDENPEFIAALMDDRAMTIPENTDPRSAYRPVSVGPVFSVDTMGNLHMRYSARGRNIIWQNDKKTDDARAFLTHILSNDPLILRHKLQSGQGIISNNVLHNRTGFVDAEDDSDARLLYRIRYKERVSQTENEIN